MDDVAYAEPFKIEWDYTYNLVVFILSNDVAGHPSRFLKFCAMTGNFRYFHRNIDHLALVTWKKVGQNQLSILNACKQNVSKDERKEKIPGEMKEESILAFQPTGFIKHQIASNSVISISFIIITSNTIVPVLHCI